MDRLREMGEFLVSRRAKVKPDQVGLPSVGSRRVPGLRREEVATLAGVSPDYYVQIERGRVGEVSDSVLYAIAQALLLNETETAYLFDLAHARSDLIRRRMSSGGEVVPREVQPMMDHLVGAAAVVQNGRLDLVNANDLGRALYSEVFDTSDQPNYARYVFLDARSAEFYRDWSLMADYVVSILRAEAGRLPRSRDLDDLIGELMARSDEFRKRWTAHDVRLHQRGSKRLHHRVVGDLTVDYEGLEIPGTDHLTLFVFAAAPGDTATEDALHMLARWAKVPHEDVSAGQPPLPGQPAAAGDRRRPGSR